MGDSTTVKVQTSTRDLLLQIGASRRLSADQVILAALAAMQRDERRRLAAEEARAVKTTRPTSLKSERSSGTWPRCMRGQVYRLPARGSGQEQPGPLTPDRDLA